MASGTIKSIFLDPELTQASLLRGLLSKARETEWGEKYQFGRITEDADFVRRYQSDVPLHDYEAYREDVERVRRGDAHVFWPGVFKHFAVSSGTVSDGNIIPVSREMLRLNRRFSLLAAREYIRKTGKYNVLSGKVLTVPGRVEQDADRPDQLIGEISGLLASISPMWIRSFYEAVPRTIQNMSQWDDKLNAITERTVDRDIRAIAMVPSWAVVLFRKVIEAYNRRHGRVAQDILDVWPNLNVFFSGGVALSSYRDLLLKQVGGEGIDFIESYGASEGFFSFQDRPVSDDMLLHVNNGVFYEFVRMDDSSSVPHRYTIGEVEVGVPYAIHVSTCSGLWGYRVGDILEFTQTRPYRIRVAGRTAEVMDKYGEGLYGDEARRALVQACKETGSHVMDFHIAPMDLDEETMPRHQWLIEFEGPSPDLERFSDCLDKLIQSINRHYTIRREAGAFLKPVVIPLREGTFYDWFLERGKQVSAQSKVPRMSTDSEIATELLSISRNNTFSNRDAVSNSLNAGT